MRNIIYSGLTLTIICLLFAFLNSNVIAIDFFFNTRDGLGFSDKTPFFEYTLGFPYTEIALLTPISSFEEQIQLKLHGGVDILNNSFSWGISPRFLINNFSISTPLILTTRFTTTNEATEVGRFYVGLVSKFNLLEMLNLELGIYYSALYLWYDPAFEVNIPVPRTDDIFRAKFDFKSTYANDAFSFSIGYSALFRWLSYRSILITSENLPYLEGKFKLSF
ncbi:MAG: hypothetical protein ACK40U_07410 [Fervidobacterium pennivorans]